MEDNGLRTEESRFPARETMDRLVDAATASDLHIFARIDHAAGAAAVGLSLRPTELLIFGNPKGGTPLMQDNQTAGIDLPVKALVWQDAEGRVWLGYNDPRWIADRHGLGEAPEASVVAMGDGLAKLSRAACVG
jgi:uncharacterized protein (DUF302 family)